jgi:hypothetical protein
MTGHGGRKAVYFQAPNTNELREQLRMIGGG